VKQITYSTDVEVGGRKVKAGEPVDVAEIGLPLAKQMVKEGLAQPVSATDQPAPVDEKKG
jgi:hypothetical protein